MDTPPVTPPPVVVCLDGGSSDVAALDFAVDKARSGRTRVVLHHLVRRARHVLPDAGFSTRETATYTSLQLLTAAARFWDEARRSGDHRPHREPIAVVAQEAGCLVLGVPPEGPPPWAPGPADRLDLGQVRCPVYCVPPPVVPSPRQRTAPVVVAVAHSQELDTLLDLGLAEAARLGTGVRVVHVGRSTAAQAYAVRTPEGRDAWTRDAVREVTERSARACAGAPDVAVVFAATHEEPARVLAGELRTAALLVVGQLRTTLPTGRELAGACPVVLVAAPYRQTHTAGFGRLHGAPDQVPPARGPGQVLPHGAPGTASRNS
ncbi:universal stress protein [Marmoricola sp. RAF53]|uniref:universal stress protein n=1 Tax=Marmoricola sp. RAF53 TaxID=3233059 RepID=UPI003F954391